MKQLISVCLSIFCVLALTAPASAAGSTAAEPPAFTLLVGTEETALALDDLPCPPYREGDHLMVPLRRISEALGYHVDWDSRTGAITVDDGSIQKAVLRDGCAEVAFESHLKVIDLSRTIRNAVPTVVHAGYTYVPLAFFEEFFNDVSEDNGVIRVAPSMSELAEAQ